MVYLMLPKWTLVGSHVLSLSGSSIDKKWITSTCGGKPYWYKSIGMARLSKSGKVYYSCSTYRRWEI